MRYIFRKTEIKKKLYYLPLFDSRFIDDLIVENVKKIIKIKKYFLNNLYKEVYFSEERGFKPLYLFKTNYLYL